MKQLTTHHTRPTILLLIASCLLLASCGTSSNNSSDNVIGTWKTNNAWASANWIGGDESGNPQAVATVTRVASAADSSSQDSVLTDSTVTMVYPNSDFSAEMVPNVFRPDSANISLTIIDHQIPPAKGIHIKLDTSQSSLGNNFIKYFGITYEFLGNGYKISPTYKFDCSKSIQLSQGNLRYIVTVQVSDSTYNIYTYNLRLKGVQQAAEKVACN